MCCFTQSIHTLRLSVGGRMHGRTDGRTENIYSVFRDKLLLRGKHVYLSGFFICEKQLANISDRGFLFLRSTLLLHSLLLWWES